MFAFAVPFVHMLAFWIAYACTLAIFAALGYAGNSMLKSRQPFKVVLLRRPLLRLVYIASAVQIIAFFALGALADACPVPAAIIGEGIILVAALIGLLARDTTEIVNKAVERETSNNTLAVRQLRAQANALLRSNTDPALQSALERISEALRYADPVSNAATVKIEACIAEKLSDISTAPDAIEVLRLIHQRAELCKAGKR